jgi:hypothetical protein
LNKAHTHTSKHNTHTFSSEASSTAKYSTAVGAEEEEEEVAVTASSLDSACLTSSSDGESILLCRNLAVKGVREGWREVDRERSVWERGCERGMEGGG